MLHDVYNTQGILCRRAHSQGNPSECFHQKHRVHIQLSSWSKQMQSGSQKYYHIESDLVAESRYVLCCHLYMHVCVCACVCVRVCVCVCVCINKSCTHDLSPIKGQINISLHLVIRAHQRAIRLERNTRIQTPNIIEMKAQHFISLSEWKGI